MAPTTAPLWSAISIFPKARGRTRPSSRCTAADGSYPAATSTGSWDSYLAAHGYAVFSIDYRLTRDGENHYPAAVHDVRAAVQWARSHAAELNIDPARLALTGRSAGRISAPWWRWPAICPTMSMPVPTIPMPMSARA